MEQLVLLRTSNPAWQAVMNRWRQLIDMLSLLPSCSKLGLIRHSWAQAARPSKGLACGVCLKNGEAGSRERKL